MRLRFHPDVSHEVKASPPYGVLQSAREEWENQTEGAMTLIFQQDESESGNAMITVHAKHVPTNRTAALLSVIHRPNEPYPAAIQPRGELPDILKKSYYQPGEIGQFFGRPGRAITNEWVSDTPSEFRKKLSEAFNSSPVKTAILGLACDAASEAPESTGEVGREDPILCSGSGDDWLGAVYWVRRVCGAGAPPRGSHAGRVGTRNRSPKGAESIKPRATPWENADNHR